jgi:uncharacterized protein YajQ (UPF0234 family)
MFERYNITNEVDLRDAMQKVTDYQQIRGYILLRKPAMLRMIGLLPIVRNTHAGLEGIPEPLRESAQMVLINAHLGEHNWIEARRAFLAFRDLLDRELGVSPSRELIALVADSDFQMRALFDIVQSKLIKRGVPLKGLTFGKVEEAGGGRLRQRLGLQQGIPIDKAKEIVRLIKDTKIKVQASIQEDQVRVVGKNRDDLQKVIALVKAADLDIAVQFTNYRSTRAGRRITLTPIADDG